MDGTTGGSDRWPVHLSLIESLCRAWIADANEAHDHAVGVAFGARGHLESVLFSTDPLAGALLELQHTLGEGPAMTALATHAPVFITDLAAADDRSGSVAFAREALQVGAGSYRAVPLLVGVVVLGVLGVHSPGPSLLGHRRVATLLTLADTVALALIPPAGDGHDGAGSPYTMVSPPRAIVHQACGMVMVQIEATMLDALVTLRGYAYGSGRSLDSVAQDVIDRRLRFFPGGEDPATLDPRPPKGR